MIRGEIQITDDKAATTETQRVISLIDLLSNEPISNGGIRYMSPKDGPVVVEIRIFGVPILAHISNHSPYTLVSKSVAESFGLKRIEKLKTKEMRCATFGAKLTEKTFTCLEDFSFELGSISICLRSAMEVAPDLGGAGEYSYCLNFYHLYLPLTSVYRYCAWQGLFSLFSFVSGGCISRIQS